MTTKPNSLSRAERITIAAAMLRGLLAGSSNAVVTWIIGLWAR
jgi:hypothetical protein